MEHEVCKRMLRNLSETRGAKFLATTVSYSMVKIARLDDAFSEMFELEASPVEGQPLRQKDRKVEKGKAKKILKKPEKPKDVSAHAQAKMSQNAKKKGMLSCCKYLFE